MRRPLALLCLSLCAPALSACGTTTASTSSFKGAKREVAQTIADLQADATASEQKKICGDDLAASVVRRLGGSDGCEAAITHQLKAVDSLEVSVESVALASSGTSASAQVRSVHEGKKRPSTVSLVKEGGHWKISGL